MSIPKDMRCCFNCKRWHKSNYIHCQHSGPYGGDIQCDKRCKFISKHDEGKARKDKAMGWGSGTDIFDAVAEALLENGEKRPKEILKVVANVLEEGDWDCQKDSDYWDHPVVQEIMKEMHPRWFEDE